MHFVLVLNAKERVYNSGINKVLINHFSEGLVDIFKSDNTYCLIIKIKNNIYMNEDYTNLHFYNLHFNYYDVSSLEDLYEFLCDQVCICLNKKYITLKDLEAINLNLMGVYPTVNSDIYLDADINLDFDGLFFG